MMGQQLNLISLKPKKINLKGKNLNKLVTFGEKNSMFELPNYSEIMRERWELE